MLSALPRFRGLEGKEQLPAEVAQGLQDGSLFHCVMDIEIRDGQFLHLADKVESITGVWDLPLIGAETLDVEHEFQQLTGGPEVTLTVLDGTFVENATGEIAQIQDRFDSPEMKAIQQEVIDKLKTMGVKQELKLREKKLPPDDKRNYFPAGGLPHDSVMVVRTAALAEFQELLAEQDSDEARVAIDKSVGQRERATLLTIIAALAN